ncbi:putative integral membrane protein (TIGR00698 family) [Hymenobacter luteus]|uniref:Integral membrane protein (TIGR00698 family) n=2 Tax=Hymenobacter TaxID=89966 RepID=A0ABR6JTN7_9BACT|nr:MULTISPECIES: putative sulfate exporter family transporter [Hymenobacter]MBB4600080.1 putative integral membrane protein (TIGR00698 family) [Hymenobacter latericoloratus]MBB6057610.1 putative integral membrane protein (TIGR00698 family) [Hymenobacter luteus]
MKVTRPFTHTSAFVDAPAPHPQALHTPPTVAPAGATPGLAANRSGHLPQVVFVVLLGICLTPWASPPVALALGLVLAQTVGNPFLAQTRKLTAKLLQYSVIGLGFGMNAQAAVQAGQQGLLFTAASIAGTLGLGYVAGRWLGLGRHITHLISCGTAICGGSAIAAVGPVLRAKEEEMSVALATVFVLNALALFAFPVVGHALSLSQNQFGLWCAIAIHDTSSVVGAAAAYGEQALQVATTVKLARALWIVPVALGTALVFRQKDVKVKIPYFILGFIGAMLLNTYVPATHVVAPYLVQLAKLGLTVTLFFIGAGLSMRAVKAVGPKPFILGTGLWLVVSLVSLYAILHSL